MYIKPVYRKFTQVCVCQNLSKLSDVSQSYSKNNLVQFLPHIGVIMTRVARVILCDFTDALEACSHQQNHDRHPTRSKMYAMTLQ